MRPPSGPRPDGGRAPSRTWGSLVDVPGVRVGHAHRVGGGWLSGVTVVLPPPRTVAAVEVRGGGPGTHETDALDPTTLVPFADAVVLTGGSAYGLAAASGVQAWCEEHGRGVPVGPPQDRRRTVVPIVPAAAVFDLGRGGDPRARPDAALGREAVEAAAGPAGAGVPGRGCVGAGTGAVLAGGTLKGGTGTASVRLPGGVVVGALAVVNAFGSPVDHTTGALLGAAFVPPDLPRPAAPSPAAAARVAATLAAGPSGPGRPAVPPAQNTTLAVVATNADLDPARARRAATAAHAGLARALDPAHTLLDGDTVFALATGQVSVEPAEYAGIHAAFATALTLAILDGVLAATPVRTPGLEVPAYADLVAEGG